MKVGKDGKPRGKAISMEEVKRRMSESKPKEGSDPKDPAKPRIRLPDNPPLPPGDRAEPATEEPPPPSSDPWSNITQLFEDESGYDENAFYTMTKFADEGTVQIRAAVSKQLMYVIKMMVQSGQLPHYKTEQDAVRDALVHLVKRRYQGVPAHIQKEIDRLKSDISFISWAESQKRSNDITDKMIDMAEELLDQRTNGEYSKNSYEKLLEYVKTRRDRVSDYGRTRFDQVIKDAEEHLENWNSGG